MSDIATADPARQPAAPRVQRKLRTAIELMVHEGLQMHEAAQRAGTTTRTVREAFAKPHVIQFMRKERQVLLASARARNIPRLVEIRDAADNMPAVQAIKLLEEMGEDRQFGGAAGQIAQSHPGVTIVINDARQVDLGHGVTIDGQSTKSPAIPGKSTT